MILIALLGIPLVAGGLLMRARGTAVGALHAVASVGVVVAGIGVAVAGVRGVPLEALGGLLRVDGLSGWMAVLIAVVGGVAAWEAPQQVPPSTPRFYPLFHLFLFTMLLAVTTADVGLMWVAIEGTTLASVFLVNAERSRASLEAAYKYLLICSVGITIAFLGTTLVYLAGLQVLGLEEHALRWTTLLRVAPSLPPRIVELAFVFLLVGYGTKAGLAPMHTWLPDAHSEAPAPVSALMSGVLLAVGVYAILRFKAVVDAAAGPAFARGWLLALGLASMAVAAAFLWTPQNYKRMLAYSSVEHMGIVCLGIGFGGAWGTVGALLHIANHGLVKSTLFLLSGRIRAAYGSTDLGVVRGVLGSLPGTGALFFAGMLALMGLPPFGLFVSEIMIFRAGVEGGYWLVSAAGLLALVVAFGGLLRGTHRLLYGRPGSSVAAQVREPVWRSWPMVAALLMLVLTGLAWPARLHDALHAIAGRLTP